MDIIIGCSGTRETEFEQAGRYERGISNMSSNSFLSFLLFNALRNGFHSSFSISITVLKEGILFCPFSYIIWSSSFPEMATFEESFLYPLVLLLIGAGLSGGLVTLLSHELEKRRKEREIEVEHNRKKLEIKVDIASKMSEAMAYQLSDIIILFGRKKKTLDDAEKDAVYES